MKPAEQTPLTALYVAELSKQVGFQNLYGTKRFRTISDRLYQIGHINITLVNPRAAEELLWRLLPSASIWMQLFKTGFSKFIFLCISICQNYIRSKNISDVAKN